MLLLPIIASQTSSVKIKKRGSGLTKKAESPPTNGVNRDSGTTSANGGWLRRLVRHQNPHNSQKPVIANLSAQSCSRLESGASFLFKARNFRLPAQTKICQTEISPHRRQLPNHQKLISKSSPNLRRSLDA